MASGILGGAKTMGSGEDFFTGEGSNRSFNWAM